MTPKPVVDTVPRSYEEYRQRRDRIGPGALDEDAYKKVMTQLRQEIGYSESVFRDQDLNNEIAGLNSWALNKLGLIRPSFSREANLSPVVYDIADFLEAQMPSEHTEEVSADAYPSSIRVDTNNRIITGLPKDHELIAFGQFEDGREFIVHRFYDNSDPNRLNEIVRADIGNGDDFTSFHARARRSLEELSVYITNVGVLIIQNNSDKGEFVPEGLGRPFPVPRLYRRAANLDGE